ncbi:hypothetical protein NQ318_006655 [Aromia moschata]|uniref:Uncharacterized protein n=1 Tax=Aromia moschata TaxID=1265417 RepID=A0AAV8YT53_9CUCU|nr:hypothetical protein NQ318_006655 [Aromia moschata]
MQKVTGSESVDSLSLMSNATAGFLASFFSSLAICPTELIKCKLQAMHETKKQQEMLGKKLKSVGPYKLTAQIIKNEGMVGLFRGLIPTLVREMPGYFVFFGGYEGDKLALYSPHAKSSREQDLLICITPTKLEDTVLKIKKTCKEGYPHQPTQTEKKLSSSSPRKQVLRQKIKILQNKVSILQRQLDAEVAKNESPLADKATVEDIKHILNKAFPSDLANFLVHQYELLQKKEVADDFR